MSAASRWADALAAWAIPQDILDAAPEPPWHFPPTLFHLAAELAMRDDEATRPSREAALQALPEGGSVLDVGAGGGAASLPLSPPAALLTAVDQSPAMLEVFAVAADQRDVLHRQVHGSWPALAAEVETADVVVCHNVAYNVGDLVPFAGALTDHARTRVVLELNAQHPMVSLNHAWLALHGIERPTAPTATDAVAVLEEMGLEVHTEEFERPSLFAHLERDELVAFARRRLCVGPDRDAEIDALLVPGHDAPLRQFVTLWWPGTAS